MSGAARLQHPSLRWLTSPATKRRGVASLCISHTNVVQHRGVDSNKLTPTYMSNLAIFSSCQLVKDSNLLNPWFLSLQLVTVLSAPRYPVDSWDSVISAPQVPWGLSPRKLLGIASHIIDWVQRTGTGTLTTFAYVVEPHPAIQQLQYTKYSTGHLVLKRKPFQAGFLIWELGAFYNISV